MNLGSPSAPTTPAVRRYLQEFLTDGRVIDISALVRYPLVYGIIAPFRAPKSAHAYKSIWTDRGSPLLVNTAAIAEKLQKILDPTKNRITVAYSMRYGEPSFRSQWKRFRNEGFSHLYLAPLYPHYASSSSGSSLADAMRVLKNDAYIPAIHTLPAFHSLDGFIRAQADLYKQHVVKQVDHTIISFHGLPERHIRKADPTGNTCRLSTCCESTPPFCYRAHSFATARHLARSLNLKPESYTVAFQSRLGRDPWLLPATDDLIMQLANKGIKSLAVMSPSFVADCLETLEEIAIRGRDSFLAAGGQSFVTVPCVNDHDIWVKALAEVVSHQAQ